MIAASKNVLMYGGNDNADNTNTYGSNFSVPKQAKLQHRFLLRGLREENRFYGFEKIDIFFSFFKLLHRLCHLRVVKSKS